MARTPGGVSGSVKRPLKTRLMMDGPKYPEMEALDSHTLEIDEPETTDRVEYPYLLWNDENKEFEQQTIEIVPETITSVSFTITIPAFDNSQLEEIREGRDKRNFFAVRDTGDYTENLAKIMRTTAALGPIVESGVLTVSNTEIDEPEGATTTGTASNVGQQKPLKAAEVKTLASTPLYAVGFTGSDANGFLESNFTPKDIMVAGNDATDAYLGLVSSSSDAYANRWDTDDEITPSIGSGRIITSLVRSQGIVVGTWANDADPGTATDGGVWAYVNGAVTVEDAIGIPMYACAALDGTFYFGGKGGVIYTSNSLDPAIISQVTHAVTSNHISDMDADSDNNVVYVVTASGNLLTVVSANVSDASAYLPGSSTNLQAVKVLGDNHVAVGGASGYFAEHRKATRAAASNQYTQSQINAGSGTIRAIAGNDFRVMVGIDTKIFERSLLTLDTIRLEFSELAFDGGAPSGNIMALTMLMRYNEPNFGAGVTAGGEIIYINPIAATV